MVPEKVKRLRIKKHRRRKSKPVGKWTQRDIYLSKPCLPPVSANSVANLKACKKKRVKSVKVILNFFLRCDANYVGTDK